jgi:hypothetical protein
MDEQDDRITLNGRPAFITGFKTRFPHVVDRETGLSAEWCHETIARILARDGAFFSLTVKEMERTDAKEYEAEMVRWQANGS